MLTINCVIPKYTIKNHTMQRNSILTNKKGKSRIYDNFPIFNAKGQKRFKHGLRLSHFDFVFFSSFLPKGKMDLWFGEVSGLHLNIGSNLS